MKNLKTGFSLAELLICLAIIAVVATFGFTITKHSIDKAYDRYIYTGYRALHDAILEANAQGYEFVTDKGYQYNNFIGYLGYLLDKNNKINNPGGYDIIYAKNGIQYTINTAECSSSSDKCSMVIEMVVPRKKTSSGNKNTICLGYWPQEDYGILLPLEKTEGGGLDSCTSSIDVRNRIDLLPFYLDDGTVGRYIDSDGDGDREYQPRNYYSAHDAICKTLGKIAIKTTYNGSTITHYDCNDAATESGSIKPIDPRKLH